MNRAREIHRFDVLVLGGGIAGLSAAAHIAPLRRVAVLEREAGLGQHATGRSSAMFAPSYGVDSVRALTRASAKFFRRPPPDFSEDVFAPRAILHIARKTQLARLDEFASSNGTSVRRLDRKAALRLWPRLRFRHLAGAVLERGTGDIDVHALMSGFARRVIRGGGAIVLGVGEQKIEHARGEWRLIGERDEYRAPILINAAGAWADSVARAAGVRPLGLTPLRRTVTLVDPPPDEGFARWPIVFDIDERFYFRPFGRDLLMTFADETPDRPHDVRPNEEDVALAVARFETIVDHLVYRIRAKWAGLRTFTADRAPVIGWARRQSGFLWMAGLGGFGIQTAPATGAIAASLVLETRWPRDLAALGLAPAHFSPARLRTPKAAPSIGLETVAE
jgi:D-arginine dehydrogenase